MRSRWKCSRNAPRVRGKYGQGRDRSRTCGKRIRQTKTSTPSASPRRTTGTRWPRSGPARRARTSTSRSPARTTSSKAASWWKRRTSTTASCSTACNCAAPRRCRKRCRQMRKGDIGNVYMARGLVFRWRPSIGHKRRRRRRRAKLDYDLWRARRRSGRSPGAYVHYNWHWHWDYGNGDVGNQGIHETDMCMWGLGVGPARPRSPRWAASSSWRRQGDAGDADVASYIYRQQKKMIQFEVRHWNTNAEGGRRRRQYLLRLGRVPGDQGLRRVRDLSRPRSASRGRRKAGGNHFANFVKAVRSRKTSDQNGPVETAHLASALAHLGNISYRLGRQLEFDPKTEKFVGTRRPTQC